MSARAQQRVQPTQSFQVLKNGVPLQDAVADGAAPVAIIVEFNQPDVAAAAGAGSKSSAVASTHAQFDADLAALYTTHTVAKRADHPKHFTRAFNGVALQLPGDLIASVRAWPYVKRIHADGDMHAMDAGVPEVMPEEAVTDAFEGTGAGITIAVIDTGVDYTHPALGGQLGPEHKVIGGYDFVNDDADPLDDNGHGTHVAGIAAGYDDTWAGVATDAKILAYKVLDVEGGGKDSWVLAAIERAMDPDENPLTDDAVDVINLSLGSGAGGDSNHPVTLAVERAIAAGIVCVVAAGNAGHLGKASIAAPGNALPAITVGAVTDDGHVASFSAQGPTGSIKAATLPRFGIKPDVYAPGVAVTSTWLNGAFRQMDGTSMATPHVAGIAARLLQANPDWSPAHVKAALAQSADASGMMPWFVESGRVGALPAKQLDALFTPARFDFGLVDASQEVWQHTDTLSVHNLGETTETFTIGTAWLPAGVDLDFSATSVVVAPGTSVDVPFSVTAPVAALPKLDFPDAFEGEITIESETQDHVIAFSFFNPVQSRLSLAEPADLLFLFGHTAGASFSFLDAADDFFLFLPQDQYDVIAEFEGGKRVVVRENVFEEGGVHQVISAAEAIHPVTLAPTDVTLQPLEHVSGIHAITHKASGYAIVKQGGFMSMAASLPTVQYFSSFSDAYKLEVRATGFSETGDYYVLPFGAYDGLSGEMTLKNTPATMVQVNYKHTVPEGHDSVFFVPWTHTASSTGRRATMGAKLDLTDGNPFVLSAPFEKTIFMMPAPEGFSWEGHFHTLHSADFSLFNLATRVNQVTLLETEEIYLNEAGTLQVGLEQPVVYADASVVDLYPGQGVVRWAGQMDNAATRIELAEAPDGGYFLNETNDLLPRSVAMTLFRGEEVIAADSLYNVPNLPVGRWLGHRRVSVQPGQYRAVIEDEHIAANGWHIRASATLSFRTDFADPNPPRLTQLFVESEGQSGQMLYPDASHTLHVGVVDVCGWCTTSSSVDALEIQVKLMQDSVWHTLSLPDGAVSGNHMVAAALPAGLAEGLYAVRVSAADEYANAMVYELAPAFELGMSRIPVLLAPEADAQDVDVTPTIVWHPVPEAQKYEIQLATDENFSGLVAQLESPEATLQLAALLEHGVRYHWRVRAHTTAGVKAWSPGRWFETSPRVVTGEGEVQIKPFALEAVYPNPAYDQVAVQYAIPVVSQVKMDVFDVLGRRIQSLEKSVKAPGVYQQVVEVSQYAPGTYVLRLEAGEHVATRTFVRR